ncbi:hypothetical protein GCM10010493_43970 [Streptomyces lavendulae subsp. grasserius]
MGGGLVGRSGGAVGAFLIKGTRGSATAAAGFVVVRGRTSVRNDRERGFRMAAEDYDSQLLESVAVRRRRMRDAVLFGAQRGRRVADERIGKAVAGLVIAAVLCAGCVGWSFISHRLIGKVGTPGQVSTR